MKKAALAHKFHSFIKATSSFEVLVVETIIILAVFIFLVKFDGNFSGTKLSAEGIPFDSSLTLSWKRPVGYLSIVAQKKAVSWQAVNYMVSLKCTTTGFGCPADLGDKIGPTTSTQGDTTVANGFSYEYTVWILTKKDGDLSSIARYPFANGSFTGSCGTSSTCTKTIRWSAADYDALLVRDDGTSVCQGVTGCQDHIAPISAVGATFRGLPTGVNLNLRVAVNGHVTEFVGQGQSENDFYSCLDSSSGTPNTCKIKNSAGIGPLVGYEPVIYSVKAYDQNGALLEGPTSGNADSSGAFSRSWNWKYAPVVYPDFWGKCEVNCKTADVVSNNDNLSYTFAGLASGIVYRELVCVNACSSTVQYILNTTRTAMPSGQAALYRVKSSLSSDQAPRNGVVDFSWFPAKGSFSSQVLEYSYSSDFVGGTVQSVPVADSQTTIRLKGFAQNSTYYWRIKSNLASGSNITSLKRSFVVNTPPPTQLITSGDSDGDGFKDTVEQYAGTDPFKSCGVDAWLPDTNNDRQVNSSDLGAVAAHFGSYTSSNYNRRYDMNASKSIDSADLGILASKYGSCSSTSGVKTSTEETVKGQGLGASPNVLGCTTDGPCISGVVQGCAARGLQFLFVWTPKIPFNKQYIDISDDALKLASGSYYSVDVSSNLAGQYAMYGMTENASYAWRVRMTSGLTNTVTVSPIDAFRSTVCNTSNLVKGPPDCSDGPYGAYLKWDGYASYVDISTDNFATFASKPVGGLNLTSTYELNPASFTLFPGVTYKWRLWSGKSGVYNYGPDIFVVNCNSGTSASADQVRAYIRSLVYDMRLPETVGQEAFGIAGCETNGSFSDGSDVYYGIWQFVDSTYTSYVNRAAADPKFAPYIAIPAAAADANDAFKAAPVVLYIISSSGVGFNSNWVICTNGNLGDREWTDWTSYY